jgi:hypothetical protein
VSFIIEIDDRYKWRLKKDDWDSSLVQGDLVKKKEDISLGNYIAGITNYGVDKRNIHFVAASGADNPVMTEIGDMGFAISRFDSQKKIIWGFRATVPKQYEKSSFFVDISPDKTVIAWLDDDNIRYKESSASGERRVQEIRRLAKDVPTNKRGYCFIVGEVPEKMAVAHCLGDERYIVLNAPDGYCFDAVGEQDALDVYRAVYESSGCNTFVYDRNSNPVIGYLLD